MLLFKGIFICIMNMSGMFELEQYMLFPQDILGCSSLRTWHCSLYFVNIKKIYIYIYNFLFLITVSAKHAKMPLKTNDFLTYLHLWLHATNYQNE